MVGPSEPETPWMRSSVTGPVLVASTRAPAAAARAGLVRSPGANPSGVANPRATGVPDVRGPGGTRVAGFRGGLVTVPDGAAASRHGNTGARRRAVPIRRPTPRATGGTSRKAAAPRTTTPTTHAAARQWPTTPYSARTSPAAAPTARTTAPIARSSRPSHHSAVATNPRRAGPRSPAATGTVKAGEVLASAERTVPDRSTGRNTGVCRVTAAT